MLKRWTIIFKVLANVNRLKIIDMLSHGAQINVTDISRKLHISVKATSRHVIIMHNLDILNREGKAEHVFYSLNPRLPADIQTAISLFL